jgi:ubiquinone/menaquinone biosynthesis C-methylase UbiE
MTDNSENKNTQQLRKAYTALSAEEIREYYDEWAADYETHMGNVGYTHPAMVAAMLSRHVPPGDDAILDAGAGTGIMAEILTAMGYPNIVGIDNSPKMLAVAANKKKYRELRQMVLGEPLDFADDQFAAVSAAGVFTEGHAPLSGLDELIRVTRPGGHIVFSISRSYLEGSFEAKGKALEAAGCWRFVDASARYNSTPLEGELPARVYAFQVV